VLRGGDRQRTNRELWHFSPSRQISNGYIKLIGFGCGAVPEQPQEI